MRQGKRAARRRRSLVRLLLPLLVLALALSWALYDSNCRLMTERFTVPLSRLPESFEGLKIVQLSDLHGAEFGQDNQDLIEAVRREEPDLILLTGDLLDRFRETPHAYAVDLGRRLTSVAPTYFVTGNHEWALPGTRELKTALTEAGVVVLSNQFLPLERNGETLVLAGIDDPNGFADQKTPEELAAEVQAAFPDTCWLLMAHRNDRFLSQYSLLGADLVISGHGHGGIIRLPFTDGLLSTDRTLFPSYTAGLYEAGGSTLFVSRGLGNSGPSFRLFNPPEVAVLTLTRG